MKTLSNGTGFIVHGCVGPFKGKMTVWVNSQGVITDAEQYPNPGRTRHVKRRGPAWNHVQSYVSAVILRDGFNIDIPGLT